MRKNEVNAHIAMYAIKIRSRLIGVRRLAAALVWEAWYVFSVLFDILARSYRAWGFTERHPKAAFASLTPPWARLRSRLQRCVASSAR